MTQIFPTHLPEERDARWRLLDAILERWFPRGEPASVSASEIREAERRLGRSLPPALCEWYGSSGARSDVWCVQDRLLAPEELQTKNGFIVFVEENQKCWLRGFPEAEHDASDPPVFISHSMDGKQWESESDSLSRFALQYAMMNLKFADKTKWSANAPVTHAIASAVEVRYRLLPFGVLQTPLLPTRFHGDDDIVIELEGDDWLWATAQDKRSLEQLDELLRTVGIEWTDISSP